MFRENAGFSRENYTSQVDVGEPPRCGMGISQVEMGMNLWVEDSFPLPSYSYRFIPNYPLLVFLCKERVLLNCCQAQENTDCFHSWKVPLAWPALAHSSGFVLKDTLIWLRGMSIKTSRGPLWQQIPQSTPTIYWFSVWGHVPRRSVFYNLFPQYFSSFIFFFQTISSDAQRPLPLGSVGLMRRGIWCLEFKPVLSLWFHPRHL